MMLRGPRGRWKRGQQACRATRSEPVQRAKTGDARREAVDEGLALVLDRVGEPEVDDLLDVVHLVVVGDGDVAAVGDEVVDLLGAKRVRLDRKRQLEDVLDRVLGHPLEARVVRRVDRLEVLQAHVLGAEQLAVDRADEVRVEQAAVLDSLGEHDADKLEEGEVVRVDRAQPVELVRERTARRRLKHYSERNDIRERVSDEGPLQGLDRASGDARAKSGLKIDLARTLVDGRQAGETVVSEGTPPGREERGTGHTRTTRARRRRRRRPPH